MRHPRQTIAAASLAVASFTSGGTTNNSNISNSNDGAGSSSSSSSSSSCSPPRVTGDEDAFRRLLDRSCRRVFGTLLTRLTTTAAEGEGEGEEGSAASLLFGLPVGTAISVATALFPEGGGARQISAGGFRIAATSSSNSTTDAKCSGDEMAFNCECTVLVSASPLVAALPTPAHNQQQGGKHGKASAASANSNKASSQQQPSSAPALTLGHAAFIRRALRGKGGEEANADDGANDSTSATTASDAALADAFADRLKAARQLAGVYLNNEWLPPILQSLAATGGSFSSSSNSALAFATLRSVLGSAVHTSAEGKKRRVPLPLSYDVEDEAAKAREGRGEEEEELPPVGFGEEAPEKKSAAGDKDRRLGAKHGRGDAAPVEGTAVTPNSAGAVFMAEPAGALADGIFIVGVDEMYAYLGAELDACEYDALRCVEERRKKGLAADGAEDGEAVDDAAPRGRHASRRPQPPPIAPHYPMRAPRTFGVVGRVPIPMGNSNGFGCARGDLFAGYKSFTSRNRSNRAHTVGDDEPSGPVTPPAHILWVSESARPKKPTELAAIRWADGNALFAMTKGALDEPSSSSSVVSCSALLFSWVARAIIGRRGHNKGGADEGPAASSSSSVPFLVPIIEVEDACITSVGFASSSSSDAEQSHSAATFRDLCGVAEGSASRLVRRSLKHSAASAASAAATSTTSDIAARLADCGSVHFTDGLLGKAHPHAQWLRAQRRLHSALVEALSGRVWREGMAIDEPTVLAAAVALEGGWRGGPAATKAVAPSVSSSPTSLTEGPCVEFKHKVSEYSFGHSGGASMAQSDVERLRHTVTAMAASLGGVIVVGVRDDDGTVVGHPPSAVKDNLRTSAFFPAMQKDSVRVIEVKVRPQAATANAPAAGGNTAAPSAASASAMPAGWWKAASAQQSTSAGSGGGGSALAAAAGAARSLVGASSSSASILMARLAAASASAAPAPSAAASASNTTAAAAAPARVVTIVAVEPSAAPFVLPTLRPFSRHAKVRAGGAGNASLTVGGMVGRLLVFAPSEDGATSAAVV